MNMLICIFVQNVDSHELYSKSCWVQAPVQQCENAQLQVCKSKSTEVASEWQAACYHLLFLCL